MSKVKNLRVQPLAASKANEFIIKHHYSGKVVPNSQLHLGVFDGPALRGVMQFGPSMCKENMLNLVKGTRWNDFIELNRMAFDEGLPKNSESRCIAIALRMLKKHYPHIKWVITFADGTQCGDGTIYRAAGFLLTGIKPNAGIRQNPKTGEILHTMAAYHRKIKREFTKEWVPLPGYQFRYIYFLDPTQRQNLNTEVIEYKKIKELGISMYKGQKCST